MSISKEMQESIVKMGYQFAWSQLIHDRAFHQDIDCLNPKEKYSHFAHHIAKYTPELVDSNGSVNYRVLADLLIITTSMANACRISIKDVWKNTLNEESSAHGHKYRKMTVDDAEIITLKFMARKSADLGKACEALDHIENFSTGAAIKSTIQDIYNFIYGIWTQYIGKSVDELFELALNRLLYVEMKHPFYLNIKKQQHAAQLGKAIEAYVNLPTRTDELLKQMNASDGNGWNMFSQASYRMVMDLPAILILEDKKLIMREMTGAFTVTKLGKEHLENII